MLDEAGIDSHRLFFLCRHFGDSCPKACRHGGNLFSRIGKVHLEWRIAHYEIKLAQLLTVIALVIRTHQGVALYGIV